MNPPQVFTVEQRVRLDRFLQDRLSHLSRRHLHRLIAAGDVMVNGRRCTKKGAGLAAGDQVAVDATLATTTSLVAQPELDLAVLYQDDHLVGIAKPAGIASVGQRPADRDTAANFVVARWPETASLEHGYLESGILHRLDTGTSGVLLAARTPLAYGALRAGFGEGAITKTYLTRVGGTLTTGGSIVDALAPVPGDRRRMKAVDDAAPGGRAAETQFQPLHGDAETTLLRVRIATGVRHQIRAHLASIGHPIVGDTLYGGTTAERLMLHASSVQLSHPARSETISIEADPPPSLDPASGAARGPSAES